jgi:hypothetical protein
MSLKEFYVKIKLLFEKTFSLLSPFFPLSPFFLDEVAASQRVPNVPSAFLSI